MAIRISTRAAEATPLLVQGDALVAYHQNIWRVPLGPGRRVSASIIDWTFAMPDGSRFTAPQWQPLRETAKAFLWSLHGDPPSGRRPVSLRSLPSLFFDLRTIIVWMAQDGTGRFADVDDAAIDRFMTVRAQRRGKTGRPLARGTVQGCIGLLQAMHDQRAKLDDAPPNPPRKRIVRQGGTWAPPVPIPHTPDPIAIPLLAGALALIEGPADAILSLRDEMQQLFDDARARGRDKLVARLKIVMAMKKRLPVLPEWSTQYPLPKGGIHQLNFMVDRVADACFVVIAYLVGARASEILTLRASCIAHEWDAATNATHDWLVGSIHKAVPYTKGKPHRWIAPQPVVRAVDVLERLSAPLRAISGQQLLWLFQAPNGNAVRTSDIPIRSIAAESINRRLNTRLVPFLGVPDYEGAPWHVSTHQGRKTFARFIGRRDRTGLFALQKHLGHITRAITDRGYVGTDFELADLIDAQVVEETRHALEELLVAPQLAGKAGRMLSERSPFRGRTRDGDFDAYVNAIMADSGMRLGVCDWGYCLYRQENAACRGDERGPNPALRTQSTCASCANFVVSEKHRPVWEARRQRNLSLMALPLDLESAKLARDRVDECDRVLAQFDVPQGDQGEI